MSIHLDIQRQLKGSELHPDDRKYVLAAYIHRFTKEHTPSWAKGGTRKDGSPYPVHFSSDQEWLENTVFSVRKDGRLDRRMHSCYSTATWPDNPELRKEAA